MNTSPCIARSGIPEARGQPEPLGKRCSLGSFSFADAARCGAVLRELGNTASTMDDLAGATVRYLFDTFRDPQTGGHELALVQFVKAHAYGSLPARFQQAARQGLVVHLCDTTRCLALLGTAGAQRDWNARNECWGHLAMPLLSAEAVSRSPLIAQLVRQLGLDLESVVRPSPEQLGKLDARAYHVFHVPEALDTPFVPAREELIKRYAVRSVLAFGGMLPTGNLFAVILFARTAIPRQLVDLFETLALCIKASILPFESDRVFAGEVTTSDSAQSRPCSFASKSFALESLATNYGHTLQLQAQQLAAAEASLQAVRSDLQREAAWRKAAEPQLAELQQLQANLAHTTTLAGDIYTHAQYAGENVAFVHSALARLATTGATQSPDVADTDLDRLLAEISPALHEAEESLKNIANRVRTARSEARD